MTDFRRACQRRVRRNCLKAVEIDPLLRFVFALFATMMTIAGNSPRAGAAPLGKLYFFATREACAASGVFRKSECDAAFTNAFDQLRDRAPSFASRADCQIRFRLCEPQRNESATLSTSGERRSYMPLAIGIEIARAGKGAVAAPALAVEAPRGMFAAQPVSRAYVPGELGRDPNDTVKGAATPADRVEPLSAGGALDPQRSIEASGVTNVEQKKGESSPPRETPQERRIRLRNAPLVE
jgi:uncharacterized protein YgiB involved in biofilm formation